MFHKSITHTDLRMVTTAVAILALILGTGFVLTGSVSANEAVDIDSLDGEGTEDNPYVITTVEELQAMNQDLEAHYILDDDIDASETEAWNAGAGFEPIGDRDQAFSGTLDGQGHTITGLTINRAGESYVALFGELSGNVENLVLEEAHIQGDEYTAAISGWLTGDVQSVRVTGTIEANGEFAAGIGARTYENPTIEQVNVNADISGNTYVGGIVGSSSGEAIISESYSTGSVESNEFAGGVVGWHYSDSAVRQAYTTADVDDGLYVGGAFGRSESSVNGVYAVGDVDDRNADFAGGIAGITNDPTPPATKSYWSEDSTGMNTGTGPYEDFGQYGVGLTTDEMTGAAAEANMDLDFDNYWTATDEYPVLQWQVQDVDLSVSQPEIGEGESTTVTVELTLDDGSTVTATEVADYDSEEAVAGVSNGRLEANSVGQTELTATVAGESDSVTVEVLEPPNIEFVDAEFDTEAAVEGTTVEATVTYANTGGPGSETATVSVGEEDVTTDVVSVGADEEVTESLQWTAERNGTVAVDGTELGTLTIVEPGTVSLGSIDLPETAAQDSEYGIELELANDADRPVVDTIEHRVNGDTVAEVPVEVAAGGSTETIRYAHDERGTATHVVELHDEQETGTTEILAPAEFELEDLEAPDEVEIGDSDTISTTVTNVGGSEDAADITLSIGSKQVDSQSVTLAANESETLAFNATFDEAGDVDVRVESPDDALEANVFVEGDEAAAGDDGLPGFGVAAALVAIALAAAVATRR